MMEPRGYFMHRRFGWAPKGGVTAYFTVEILPSGRYEVSYSLARCNPVDNFTKRIGRQIARGRFEKRRELGDVMTYLVEAPDFETARERVIERMDQVCHSELEAIKDLHDARIGGLARKYMRLIREGVITT